MQPSPFNNVIPTGGINSFTLLTAATAADRAGTAIQITASVAGTVTLTALNGDTVIVNVAIGDNIYPYSVIEYAVGTATVTRAYNLA